jgi:protein gp37
VLEIVSEGDNLGDTTRISWANRTWNPWYGCRHVSSGCDHCYAEALLNKLHGPGYFDTVRRSKTFNDPQRWQREAAKEKRFDLVFTCSLSDFFIQDADKWRPEVWRIVKHTPNLIYQILTKRPELIGKRLPNDWGAGYKNCWLGVSVENKKFLKRMDVLRDIPAYVRFVSAEPLLEDISTELKKRISGFHQIIVGGESGNNSDLYRPMDTEWARKIMKVCRDHDVAFFFKQSAAKRTEMGTQLDGQTYYEYPAVYYEYGKEKTTLF